MSGGVCAAVALASALVGCAARPVQEGSMFHHETTEPTVYVADRVHTGVEGSLEPARAVAVSRGRIVAVGSVELARSRAPSTARVVELPPGSVIVPGLGDAHGHLLMLGASLSTVSLRAPSLEALLDRLGRAPRTSFQGDWLVGAGWDQHDWPPEQQRFPDKARLDALFPSTPVYLTRVDEHAVWVNSEALRRAGVTRRTKDPAGGRILRDKRGEPTGVLIDNAINLVQAKLPVPTPEQREERLLAALRHCASVGLTAVHDAGVDLPTYRILQRLDAEGRLPIRVYAMVMGQGGDLQTFLDEGPFQGRHLVLRAVKLWADGALGSRGAALFAPYEDEPSTRGLLLLTEEELARRARQFADRGFQVAIHAIGDRANAVAIDLLGALEQEKPGSRHRLEHAQILRAEDLARLRGSGLVVSMQPTHATSDMRFAAKRLGEQRVRGAYAWRSVAQTGVVLAFGSDFPIESPNPLLGLYAARTRQDLAEQPAGGWFPEERLDARDALRAFTLGTAEASFAERDRGVLEEERAADFVALSVDPLDPRPTALLSGRVLLTVVDGVEVYAPGASPGLSGN